MHAWENVKVHMEKHLVCRRVKEKTLGSPRKTPRLSMCKEEKR